MRKLLLSLLSLFMLTTLSAQKPATWKFEQKDNGDGTYDLIFNVSIAKPWYVYSAIPVQNGPMATAVHLQEAKGVELVGGLMDAMEPHKKYDESFATDIFVFEDNAQFVQKIKKSDNSPVKITGTIEYQCCNGKECLLDEEEVAFFIGDASNTAAVDSAKENVTTDTAPVTEKKSDNSSMWTFLLIAFLAGLGGVATPCVFPMIPMTVSFFISGDGNKRSGIIKGVVFGISVTLIYTMIGVLVALLQSTTATDVLGTHWIPNLLFAVLFIIFAISFFGAFEITLPSGLANKADAKADKGGIIASFFVAFAMVIVSFSCTGPFVGSILAAAVMGGLALKPILGMFVFGLAFSLPFVLFSFFPSLMKKMPKSGGWLNVVKVVFAFILLGFSLKYLAAVDTYFGWGIVSRAIVISIWIVLSLLMGIYLLGKLKTSHDSDTQFVGVGRLFFAIASFSFAVYLIPGLFGAPLPSLSALLPAMDNSTFVISNAGSQAGSENIVIGEFGPIKYADSKHSAPYGLTAYYEIEQAMEVGKKTGKPVLLSFKSTVCSACKHMEATVWSDPKVQDLLKNKVILANLYIDNKTELPVEEQVISKIDGKAKTTLGKKLRDYQLSNFEVSSQPYYVLIGEDGKPLVQPVGECSLEEYLKFLNDGIAAFENNKK